jgi:transaldolase
MSFEPLKVKIYCDGANKEEMLRYNADPEVSGMTTNPSLMRKAGVVDYVSFCKEILKEIKEKPVSFEVFADEISEMAEQAKLIATWGKNLYVKIPILNTKGESTAPLIRELSSSGVKINVTAVLTEDQIQETLKAVEGPTPSILSVFAGRIADTGRDPLPIMKNSVLWASQKAPQCEVLWASTREVFNLVEADRVGCHIITVPGAILEKYKSMRTKSLYDVSLDTVQTFKKDSDAAGYKFS